MLIEPLDLLAKRAFVCLKAHDHAILGPPWGDWPPLDWRMVGVYPDTGRKPTADPYPVYGARLPVTIDGGAAWACLYTSSPDSWELTIEGGQKLFWEVHLCRTGGEPSFAQAYLREAVIRLCESEEATLRERRRDKLFATLDAQPAISFTGYLQLPEGGNPLDPAPWPGAQVWAETIEIALVVHEGQVYMRHSGPRAYRPWYLVERDRIQAIVRGLLADEPMVGGIVYPGRADFTVPVPVPGNGFMKKAGVGLFFCIYAARELQI